jgi:starch-binding outer membrane protein, SusD/RagB family
MSGCASLRYESQVDEMVKRRNHEAGSNIHKFHNLRPIPQDQIDRTRNEDNSEFGQNPGY